MMPSIILEAAVPTALLPPLMDLAAGFGAGGGSVGFFVARARDFAAILRPLSKKLEY